MHILRRITLNVCRWSRCYSCFFRARAQQWRLTDRILGCRRCRHEELFISLNWTLNVHNPTCSHDPSCSWPWSQTRRDGVAIWFFGHLDHLSFRASAVQRFRYRRWVDMRYGLNVLIVYATQGVPVTRLSNMLLPAEEIGTRTRFVFVPYSDWFGKGVTNALITCIAVKCVSKVGFR